MREGNSRLKGNKVHTKKKTERIAMNYLETIDYYMDMGMSEEDACRAADMEFNPNYCADDYDDPYGLYR